MLLPKPSPLLVEPVTRPGNLSKVLGRSGVKVSTEPLMMRSKVLGDRGQSTRMSQPAWNGWNAPIHKVGQIQIGLDRLDRIR